MPDSLSDWMLSLLAPGVMCASGIYAGLAHLKSRRDRRRGVRPHGVPAVYVARREVEDRIVRNQMVAKAAELIVDAELERVAPLYDEPTERRAHL